MCSRGVGVKEKGKNGEGREKPMGSGRLGIFVSGGLAAVAVGLLIKFQNICQIGKIFKNDAFPS